MDIDVEKLIEAYYNLKKYKDAIRSIDKDFFFNLVDELLQERGEYKNTIKELEKENKKIYYIMCQIYNNISIMCNSIIYRNRTTKLQCYI